MEKKAESKIFQLSPITVAALEELAQERGISLIEALRQAIGTEIYLRTEVKKGAKLLLQERGKITKELVFKK